MSGKVSFPVVVEVGFGAGPFDDPVTWTDVSDWVQRGKTITCSRGFDVETTEPTPGRGQLRFKNDDGRFTPGETGAFGLVRNRLPIRISARVGTGTGNPLVYDESVGWYDMAGATYDDAEVGSLVLWTGLIEKLSMGFEEGYRPVVDATLVDRWARLKKRVLTGDRALQVCLASQPTAFWPLTDLAAGGLVRFAPIGAGFELTEVQDYYPGLVPAASANPQPGMPAVAQAVVTAARVNGSEPGTWPATAITLMGWVKCPGAADTINIAVNSRKGSSSAPFLALTVTRDAVQGTVTEVRPAGASATFTDTATGWRHVAAVVTGAAPGTLTLRLFVDGIYRASHTVVVSGSMLLPRDVEIYAPAAAPSVAYVGVWSRALTDAQVGVIAAAGSGALGATGDTADVRAGLVASLWPTPVLTTAGTFTSTMSKQAIDGVSQADLLLACATAEAGSVSIARDGWPLLTSRGYRTEQALTATIPAQVLSKDAQWELDDAQIWNAVQVDRMALGETVTTVNRRDEASIATYDEVSRTFQLWLDSDVQAVDRADTEAIMWSQAVSRSRTFAVDVATCQAALSQADVLAIDVGSRIVISGLPATAPDQSAAGWYVDAVEDSIGMDTWMRTFTVSPAIDFLVLDDATFGGLDEFPLG